MPVLLPVNATLVLPLKSGRVSNVECGDDLTFAEVLASFTSRPDGRVSEEPGDGGVAQDGVPREDVEDTDLEVADLDSKITEQKRRQFIPPVAYSFFALSGGEGQPAKLASPSGEAKVQIGVEKSTPRLPDDLTPAKSSEIKPTSVATQSVNNHEEFVELQSETAADTLAIAKRGEIESLPASMQAIQANPPVTNTGPIKPESHFEKNDSEKLDIQAADVNLVEGSDQIHLSRKASNLASIERNSANGIQSAVGKNMSNSNTATPPETAFPTEIPRADSSIHTGALPVEQGTKGRAQGSQPSANEAFFKTQAAPEYIRPVERPTVEKSLSDSVATDFTPKTGGFVRNEAATVSVIQRPQPDFSHQTQQEIPLVDKSEAKDVLPLAHEVNGVSDEGDDIKFDFGSRTERSILLNHVSINSSAKTEQPGHLATTIAHQLAVTVHKNPQGVTEISLNPEELGKVQLSIKTSDGTVMIVIAAERPETQDLMRRHLDALVHEFRTSGFNNVSFSFAGEGQKGQESEQASFAEDKNFDQDDVATEQAMPSVKTSRDGLDLRL